MEKTRTIKGVTFKTKKVTFENFNSLTVEVGTTGTCGGDGGHGGRTYLSIKGDEMTNMSIRTSPRKEFDKKIVELSFGGDAELDTLICGLEFAVETLKEMQGCRPEVETVLDDEESEEYRLCFYSNENKNDILHEEEISCSLEEAEEIAQRFLKNWCYIPHADFCNIHSEEGPLISIVEKEK